MKSITKDNIKKKNGLKEYKGEEQYRILFENVPIGIGLVDTEGNLIIFNDAMLKPGGYTREDIEAVGNVAGLYHDPSQRIEALKLFRQQGYLNQYPVQFKRKDGTPYHALLSLTFIEMGGRPYIQATTEDVTEKKRAEETLERVEKKYRVMVEQSPLIMYMDRVDELFTSFYISPQVQTVLGYTPQEVVKNPHLWHSIVLAEDVERAKNAVKKTLEIGRFVEEYRVRHRDGRLIWLRDTSALIHGKDSEPEFIQGFMEDITERKLAEEKVKHNESRLKAMIENSLDFISLLDVHGNLLWESPSTSTLIGYRFQEHIGRNIFDLMHPDDLVWTQKQFAEVAKKMGSRQSGVFRLRHSDGAWRWVEAIATNMLNEPNVHAIVINYHDVTERKLHELELEAESMLVQALSETLELQPLLERLLEVARHAIPSADKGSILLVEANGKLRIRALSGYTDSRLQGFVFANDKGYVAQSVREKKPLIFRQTRKEDDIRYIGEIEEAVNIQSAIVAPLMIQERVIGAISLDSTEQDKFNEAHLRLLVKFATSVALVLERTDLYEEAQHRLVELQALYESGLMLSNLFEPREIGRAIVKILKQHMNWDYAVVRIRKGDTDNLETIGYGEANLLEEEEQAEINRMNRLINKVGQGLTGWVIQHGVAVYSENLPTDSRYIETNPDVLSGIYVPIISGEHIVGAIGVESESENAFDEHARRFLSTLAAQVASVLETARLFGDMQKRLAELSVLHQSSQSLLVSGFDPNKTYASVHEAVKHVMPCDAFVIVLEDNDGGDYHAVYRYDAGEHFSPARIPRGKGLSGQVISEGKTLLVEDYHNDDNVQAIHFGKPEHARSILAIPLMHGGKTIGMISTQSYEANMYNESHRVVLETIAAQFASSIDSVNLFENLERSNSDLTLAYDKTIEGWSKALDLRDRETEGHTRRVTDLTLKLAQQFGLSDTEITNIRRGALLHDIGKIGIPDHILLKPGKLTDDEWMVMRQHPQYAYDMLASVEYLRPALEIPYCHHEKWDGTGYPRGLKHEEIPISARIFAVADVWDALTSHRPYRLAWSKEQALDFIKSQAGIHFDSKVVESFLKVME